MTYCLLVTWLKLDSIKFDTIKCLLNFTQVSTETTPLTTMKKEEKPHGHARLFMLNETIQPFSHVIVYAEHP